VPRGKAKLDEAWMLAAERAAAFADRPSGYVFVFRD
jgi:hypothetical protein